jgi:hypothetical protein
VSADSSEITLAQLDVSQDLGQKAWADRLALVHRYDRGVPVRVSQDVCDGFP